MVKYEIMGDTANNIDGAKWLEGELERRGWSIRYFAGKIGVSHAHAHRVVRGNQRPSLKLCKRITKALDIADDLEVARRFGLIEPLPASPDKRERAEILELFRRLPHDRRKRLLQFGQFLEGLEEDEKGNEGDTLPSSADSA